MALILRKYRERNLPTNQQEHSVQILNKKVNDVDTSLSLVGHQYNQYEQPIGESLLWILENFSSETSPENPIDGQIWYSRTTKTIKVYDDQTLSWVVPVDIQMSDLVDHIDDINNPHNVTKDQLDLGQVINALQLVAGNNLSDLTNVIAARENLGVYSSTYIDSTFAQIGSPAPSLNGVTETQFVRSDINDTVDGTLTFTSENPLKFTHVDFVEIATIPNIFGNITVNDVVGNSLNFKVGSLTDGMTESIAESGSGSAKISLIYKDEDGNGKIVLSAANAGNINDVLTYSKNLTISADNIKWNNENILTDGGFTIKGAIVPDVASTIVIGSTILPFSTIYSDSFVGVASDSSLLTGLSPDSASTSNTVVVRDSNSKIYASTLNTSVSATTTKPSSAEIAFRSSVSQDLQFASLPLMLSALGAASWSIDATQNKFIDMSTGLTLLFGTFTSTNDTDETFTFFGNHTFTKCLYVSCPNSRFCVNKFNNSSFTVNRIDNIVSGTVSGLSYIAIGISQV